MEFCLLCGEATTTKLTNDHEIWGIFKNGDRFALSYVYFQYFGSMYQYGIKFKDDPDFVRDCIQDVFLKLIRSFRTALFMKYPKEIRPGTVIDQLVQNVDFAPALLDYGGVAIPKDIQGESFRKLVCGKSSEWHDAAYYTYYEYPAEHIVKRHYGVRTHSLLL